MVVMRVQDGVAATARNEPSVDRESGDRRQGAEEPRSQQRRERRENHAVAQRVDPAIPLVVPDRETHVVEQLGAIDGAGEVRARRVDDQPDGS